MEAKKKRARLGGRQKGTPNVRSWDIARALERAGFEPAAKLVALTLEAEKAYTANKRTDRGPSYLATASNNCAKLMKFVYPERKAIDVTSGGEKMQSLADIFASVISGNGADTSNKK